MKNSCLKVSSDVFVPEVQQNVISFVAFFDFFLLHSDVIAQPNRFLFSNLICLFHRPSFLILIPFLRASTCNSSGGISCLQFVCLFRIHS